MRGAAASATTSQDSAKQVVKDYRKAQDLNDPVVTAVLEQMQRDPRAAQERLKKSHIYDKIEKSLNLGLSSIYLTWWPGMNPVLSLTCHLCLSRKLFREANRTLKKGGKLKKKWVFAKKKEVSSPIIHTDDV
uniref:Ribosomal RNA-processing protein 8 n=1 Tax=Ditylenchus dipsaci TaxID=166011 RepID=A0A915DAU7_9BILA